MAFEALVRPFAAPTSLGTRRIPVVLLQVPDEDAILSWGEAGTLIDPQEVITANIGDQGSHEGDGGTGSPAAQFGYQIRECNTKSHETERKTKTQRVSNPDNANEFIDVEVPTQIFFKLVPQKDILHGPFSTSATAWADTDEVFNEISDIVDLPNVQDACHQAFSFAENAT